MSETEKTPSSFPSELRLSKQWDFAVERFIYNSGTGALVAGLASIVLFRTRGSRIAFTCFGFGFGAGSAYQTTNFAFEKEKQQSK
eukprot:gene6167-6638_t